jgi:hypothetical protein
MWRYPTGIYQQWPPRQRVEFEGAMVEFETLTPEQADSIGYNKAYPIVREPFTTYVTEWTKEGIVYNESIVSSVVDVEAKFDYDVAAIESVYKGKTITLDEALLNTLWADGVDMETKLTTLRAQRNQVLMDKELEILSLLT